MMHTTPNVAAGLAALLLATGTYDADTITPSQVVECHAAWCHDTYAEVEERAKELLAAVEALLESPDEPHLAAAREAWGRARDVYGTTEVLRFHDGPIEPLEPLLNAWPVDEAYIDYVVGRPSSGIINDPAGFPSLGASVLELSNERGGEANICVGWHAIEFMLWGQDLDDDGPGARPATDFELGATDHAERRREYLVTVCRLLVDHVAELRAAWSPDRDNYRRRFESEVQASVRRILVGATVLTAFELGGERLTVAYDTRDQEQEHSCFSDRTWHDFVANQNGLVEVLCGPTVDGERRPGLLALVDERRPELGKLVRGALDRTTAAIEAIPQPFDRAMRGDDDSEGRRAIDAAIRALEEQTDALLIVGKELGHDLPLEPGG